MAALEALLALRRLAEERVAITLLSPEPDFVYRPMLVAEPFDQGRVYRFGLAQIAAQQGAELKNGRLLNVDAEMRIAHMPRAGGIPFDHLLVACGAQPFEWLPGALTFGIAEADEMRRLLAGLQVGSLREVTFVVPERSGWSLPVYELALMTANRLAREGPTDASITIATPEAKPLELFGTEASDAVAELLSEFGIRLAAYTGPIAVRPGGVELDSGATLPAERVVTLPRLRGPRLDGIPCDPDGFIPVDERCRVVGTEDVYAAGDASSFPVKQGGIAAQQADTAAANIAARSGAEIEPAPFRPVLRGLLLTGGIPQYMRGALAEEGKGASTASLQPLWWPPGKIAGKHLAPYLAEITTKALPPFEAEPDNSLRIEVGLDPAASPAPAPIAARRREGR